RWSATCVMPSTSSPPPAPPTSSGCGWARRPWAAPRAPGPSNWRRGTSAADALPQPGDVGALLFGATAGLHRHRGTSAPPPTGAGGTGVQAEADGVATLGAADRLPEPVDRLQPAGHGVVTAGGVLDEHRDGHVQPVDALAPVVEPGGRVLVHAQVTPVHHHTL